MKILTTISYYRPYISGLTICAQRLIEGLSKRDFEFVVLTSRYDKSLPRIESEGKILILRRAVMFTVGKVPIMPGYLLSLIKQIRHSDLAWIHLPQAEGLITALAAKVFGKRIVATLHCLPLLPSGWQRVLFQNLFDLLNNLTIRLADRVVYYTKDYAENTPELWHFPQKSSYILPPIPGVGSKKYGVRKIKKNKEMVVGFAGRVAEDKGVEYLIAAIQLMKEGGKDARLIMAGSREAVGENSYSNKIHSLIDESGVKVEFLGVIDPEKMGVFYKLIDVLVLPSVNRTEAFGMVQVEAMLRGIPVIASDLPGVRIPIQLTKSGLLISPMNAEKFADAIVVLAKNITADFSRKIFLQNKKIFNFSQSVRSYQDIFCKQKN